MQSFLADGTYHTTVNLQAFCIDGRLQLVSFVAQPFFAQVRMAKKCTQPEKPKSRSGKSGWEHWKKKQTAATSTTKETITSSADEPQPSPEKTFADQGVQTEFAFVNAAPRRSFFFNIFSYNSRN